MLTPTQIAVSPPSREGESDYVFVLCRGGSIWMGYRVNQDEWKWEPLPKIQPGAPNNAEDWETPDDC